MQRIVYKGIDQLTSVTNLPTTTMLASILIRAIAPYGLIHPTYGNVVNYTLTASAITGLQRCCDIWKKEGKIAGFSVFVSVAAEFLCLGQITQRKVANGQSKHYWNDL